MQEGKAEKIQREMKSVGLLILLSLVLVVGVHATEATLFETTNHALGTPGGTRFRTEIGLLRALHVLEDASSFVQKLFRQPPNTIKNVTRVLLVIASMSGVVYTNLSTYDILVSADYIAGFVGIMPTEFEGLIYHEAAHVWQWHGRSTACEWLIEGIADWVRLQTGLAPTNWVKPGVGERWDQGYDVTALFLNYCSRLRASFVADLNSRMQDGYTDDLFKELLGKSVDELWGNYKAFYGN